MWSALQKINALYRNHEVNSSIDWLDGDLRGFCDAHERIILPQGSIVYHGTDKSNRPRGT